MKECAYFGIKGPFRNEAAFKTAILKVWEGDGSGFIHFEIENEEKEPGMPDVLSISGSLPALFTEFKISDKAGVVTFQKSQPLFYHRYKDIRIGILAWDVPRNRVVCICPHEVIDVKSLRITIPEVLDVS
jgi:hypothetical protein